MTLIQAIILVVVVVIIGAIIGIVKALDSSDGKPN